MSQGRGLEDEKKANAKWLTLERKDIFHSKVFGLRAERVQLPDGRVMPAYYIMDFPDWVHILAVTPSLHFVMLCQYRHAAGESFLELPGGSTDPRAPAESPLQAAQRELAEETGYTSKNWVHVISHSPNPALQSNQMHTFLAWDCELSQDPQLDDFEDLEVVLTPIADVFDLLDHGQINHSLMAASLAGARSHFKEILGK